MVNNYMMLKTHSHTSKSGLIYAFSCYIIWGFFPIYWYPLALSHMPAEQILAQRIIWSALFIVLLLIINKQFPILLKTIANPRLIFFVFLSALMLSINWLLYLWSITNQHVIDASLGYFICPLVNVVLGRIFFKDALNLLQAVAIFIAMIGVLWLTFLTGKIPIIGLIIALSFGFYGLIRKLTSLETLPALAIETLCMLPFAIVYLIFIQKTNGHLFFNELNHLAKFILMASGIITTIPLLLFSASTHHISLTNLGMIQYISPTLQFLTGLFLFHEVFNFQHFIGYLIIWIAIAIYLYSSIQRYFFQKK